MSLENRNLLCNGWIYENIQYRLGECKIHPDFEMGICDIEKSPINTLMSIQNNKIIKNKKYNGNLFRSERVFKMNAFNFYKSNLINMCDSQGWNYQKILSNVNNLNPVFQFSRKKNQRRQVILLPLKDKHFSYTDISNLPMDDISFKDKKSKLIWRGRVSGTFKEDWGQPKNLYWIESSMRPEHKIHDEIDKIKSVKRYKVVNELCKKEMCDVGFTITKAEETIINKDKFKHTLFNNLLKKRMDIQSQRQHKYIMVVDGNCFPTSLYWSLLSNSVVFYIKPEWETILDCKLKPWVHYVPVETNYEDVIKKIEFLEKNQNLALKIIENAHEYLKPYKDVKLMKRLDYLTFAHYNSNSNF